MKHSPKNPIIYPRFSEIPTFSRLPNTQNLIGADAAIIGIPFDGGTTFRPGSRLGPRGIRVSSCLNRNYNPELNVNIYDKLSVVDYGDVQTNPLSLLKTFASIEQAYKNVLSKNVIPIGLGGDHSILYPILKALKKKHKKFGLVHFDAHTDTADSAWGEKFHHGTPIRRLIEDKILVGADIFQLGIRGPLTAKNEWDEKQKINQLTTEEWNAGKLNSFVEKIQTRAEQIPFYLTFDIDGIDPAFAPGTGTPVVGGPTSAQALHALRLLKGIKFLGFDVVEVSPAYDHAEITTLLASAIVFEFLTLAAFSK